MQVQTSELTFFYFFIWGNLDFFQKSFITSITESDKEMHSVKMYLGTDQTKRSKLKKKRL